MITIGSGKAIKRLSTSDRTKECVTIAVGWRNRLAIAPTFLLGAAFFGGNAATTRYSAAVPLYLAVSLGCLIVGVSAARSGRVQIDSEKLTQTRVFRRRVSVARTSVAKVVIRTSRFGNRTSLGRNVDLKLKDGETVPIEIQVSNRLGPDRRVEGLAEQLRAWVAGDWPVRNPLA